MDKTTPAPRLPDLSDRPFHLTLDCSFPCSADVLYGAWTEHLDHWFAAPGTVIMRAEVGLPFFFETEYKPRSDAATRRHPHYGRFLQLIPNRLVQMTWVTGSGGTDGAETIVTIELIPDSDRTTGLRLTHSGFSNESTRDAHGHAWPMVLQQLEKRLLQQQPG
jgi:uncharacterized protein YndB with AHSA1/START domain